MFYKFLYFYTPRGCSAIRYSRMQAFCVGFLGALSAPGGTHSSHKAAIIQFAATVEAITAQDSLRVDGLDGLSGQARHEASAITKLVLPYRFLHTICG